MSLLQKLDQITARYAELQAALSGGALDSQKFVAASKEYADLGPLVEAIGDWRKAEREFKDQYVGTLVNQYLARGGRAVGVQAGVSYVDVGTLHGYREALGLLQGTPVPSPQHREREVHHDPAG